jgi:hypothetical protein
MKTRIKSKWRSKCRWTCKCRWKWSGKANETV